MIIASIDIGTNTILMLIAKINGNEIVTLRNEHTIPRIGKDVSAGKNISDVKVAELLNILQGYKKIADGMNVDSIICTGTNAFRIASNSDIIIKKVLQETGIKINVIPGELEAVYSFLGATDGNSEIPNLVIDIGGGSTELVYGIKKELLYKRSFQAGVVTGTEKFFQNDPPTKQELNNFEAYLDTVFKDVSSEINNPAHCIAIAGTPTTLACINKNLKVYDENLIEGSFLNRNEIHDLALSLSSQSSKEILEIYKSVVTGREDVLLSGTIILQYLMNRFDIEKIKVSTKGIRYGAVYYNYIFKDEYSG